MQTSLDKVSFLVGNVDSIIGIANVAALEPFCEQIVSFLNEVSRRLMSDARAKQYPDVVTFAFWIRKGSINKLKTRFAKENGDYRLGKGVAFHIAPSNVPVNFAYSLVAGLLTGNANIVRVPSKDFEQVSIIAESFLDVLEDYSELKPYLNLLKYGREKDVNDLFSSLADIRIVWGGDATIDELRKSPLPPRSGEITFADRYSLAVIDADIYLDMDNKKRVAEEFYNDTFFSDQNACTSPRLVAWIGKHIDEAKEEFWIEEYEYAKRRYEIMPVQAVNKLTSTYLIGASLKECRICDHKDNLIIRVQVPKALSTLMEYKENSGFFFEYDCNDILELRDVCNDKRCQTVGYIGDKAMFDPLIRSGIKGIDRIVPVGKTMDFDLIWDGYDLVSLLTRSVAVS